MLIIGAGPAGLSAAIYCARKRLKTLILSRDVGGQTAWSFSVENYLGFPSLPGIELTEKFRAHALQYAGDLELKEGKRHGVVSLRKKGRLFEARTEEGIRYRARSCIVASGKIPRRLGVPGEDAFVGKGITYCATCDAPMFRNKRVAVIGGGNSAMDAALQLDRIARKVYILNILDDLQGDPLYLEKVRASGKIEVVLGAKILRFAGEGFVKSLQYARKGKAFDLPVDGVFIEIGSVPSVDFLLLAKKNSWNEVLVDNRCRTSVPGLFACGDVTDVPEKQTVVAAGEGAKAGINVFEYLVRQKPS